jgi:hypothetical protein
MGKACGAQAGGGSAALASTCTTHMGKPASPEPCVEPHSRQQLVACLQGTGAAVALRQVGVASAQMPARRCGVIGDNIAAHAKLHKQNPARPGPRVGLGGRVLCRRYRVFAPSLGPDASCCACKWGACRWGIRRWGICRWDHRRHWRRAARRQHRSLVTPGVSGRWARRLFFHHHCRLRRPRCFSRSAYQHPGSARRYGRAHPRRSAH